jgi:hypothetical protein
MNQPKIMPAKKSISPSFATQDVREVPQGISPEVVRVRKFPPKLLPLVARVNAKCLVELVEKTDGYPQLPPPIPIKRT